MAECSDEKLSQSRHEQDGMKVRRFRTECDVVTSSLGLQQEQKEDISG